MRSGGLRESLGCKMLEGWRRGTKACGNNGMGTNWSGHAAHGKIPFHQPSLEPVREPLSKRGANTSSGQSSLIKDITFVQ